MQITSGQLIWFIPKYFYNYSLENNSLRPLLLRNPIYPFTYSNPVYPFTYSSSWNWSVKCSFLESNTRRLAHGTAKYYLNYLMYFIPITLLGINGLQNIELCTKYQNLLLRLWNCLIVISFLNIIKRYCYFGKGIGNYICLSHLYALIIRAL